MFFGGEVFVPLHSHSRGLSRTELCSAKYRCVDYDLRAPSGEIASEVSIECEKPDRCGRSQEEIIIGVLSRWTRYFYG